MRSSHSCSCVLAFFAVDDLEVVLVVVSVAFLSSYPPTQCGLATFTAALQGALRDAGSRVGVVRVRLDDLELPSERSDVEADVVLGSAHGIAAAAEALNRFDVTVVQHEFGVFGGRDGDRVLAVVDRLANPLVTVLHTVLVTPTPHQRIVIDELCIRSELVVVMSRAARRRVLDSYAIDEAKVVVIPHGANSIRRSPKLSARPTVLTWGLLGPGKGIERVIRALSTLRGAEMRPRYVVVGRTHPRVVEREGEQYRRQLEALADDLRVADMVEFVDEYIDAERMEVMLNEADVVALPYDSVDQVTSGVLAEAIAAGKPVVATAFSHAVELLAGGAGIVVAHDDAPAMAQALFDALYNPRLAADLRRHAVALSAEMLWPAVAHQYAVEFARLSLATTSAA